MLVQQGQTVDASGLDLLEGLIGPILVASAIS